MSVKAPPILLAAILMTFAHLPQSLAALVMGDQFLTGGVGNYTADANLFGQNPTSSFNFAGSWSGTNSLVFRPKATNLSVAGVTNAGGSLRADVTGNSAFSRSDNRAFTSVGGQSSLWFGTMYQPSTNALSANSSAMTGFLSDSLPTTTATTTTGATWTTGNGDTLKGFGWGVTNGNLVVSYQSDAGGSGSITTANTGFSMTINTTYFLVGKLDINAGGNDSLSLWVLTSAPSSESALGAATWTISANILTSSSELDTLNLWAGTASDGSIVKTNNFDAISIGTSYSDIVAVPEPTTAAMAIFAVASGALLLRRKRSSH